jgi:hypothetical protein
MNQKSLFQNEVVRSLNSFQAGDSTATKKHQKINQTKTANQQEVPRSWIVTMFSLHPTQCDGLLCGT